MLTGECKKIHIVPITVVRAFSVQLSAKRCFPNKIRHNDNSNKLLTSESTTKTCLASNFRWYPEISILQHKIIQILESHTLFNICSISMLSNWWVQLMKIEISVSELLLRPFCLILPSTDTTDVWIASLSESKKSKTTVDIFYPWFSASSIDSVCERQCLTTSTSSQLLLQKIRVALPFLLTASLLMIGVRCWC